MKPLIIIGAGNLEVTKLVHATDEASNRIAPPSVMIPWLWVYWPDKKLARLGQHSEVVTKLLVKVVPFPARRWVTVSMYSTSSQR